jgi:hypothetical protein
MSNKEACLDFYQASPFAIGNVQKSHRLALDPVVRVDLRSSLFLSMIAGLRNLGMEIPKMFERSDDK